MGHRTLSMLLRYSNLDAKNSKKFSTIDGILWEGILGQKLAARDPLWGLSLMSRLSRRG